ncbi:MAG: transglutaminase domain-containing protein [Candidatus Acidiferrales bacterium]
MKKVTSAVAALLFAALLAMGLTPDRVHSDDPVVAPSRSFEFTSVVHVPALPGGSSELRMWIPLPYLEQYQTISDLTITSPVAYRIDREKEYGNRYAYIAVSAAKAKAPFDIRVSFHVQRFEHRVSLDGKRESPEQPAIATARFLQPDRLVPINGVIGNLSEQETEGVTVPMDKARHIYDYVIATMHYDHDGTGWGHGDAVWACGSKHGNCTDFHSLFIGMTRAAGIPARFEIGFPLPAGAHEGAITSYHCWAQFYVQGIGWIPIDASEAWKHPEKRDYYFGATDANRVKMSLGRDIRLNPPQKGDPLNYFVYPYAELDGKPFTDLKNDYSFRDDAAPAGGSTTSSGNR